MWIWMLSGCVLLKSQWDQPVDPLATTEVEFEVPKGASARSLGPTLEAQGLISAAWHWEAYLRLNDAGGCLKAGRFRVSPAMPVPELLGVFCGVPLADDVAFTVLEGWRIREIDAALVAEGWIAAGEYAALAAQPERFTLPFALAGDDLEGLLYPDSYRVEPDRWDTAAFIQRQVDTFAVVWGELTVSGDRTPYDVVIMASMVEREEPRPANRALVAGILWKRLDGGWNLGVDATSRYSLDQWNDRGAFLKNLRDPNEAYNTRLRGGLPPGPIGNPGRSALEAAVAPEVSEWWYYLHDKDKNLHPARDSRGHEANRRKYDVY
jgi:UPF0755 protein